jgi:DNA-binding CsgD family transcriptional regulator
MALMGDTDAALRACEASIEVARATGVVLYEGVGHLGRGQAALASGDASAARAEFGRALELTGPLPGVTVGALVGLAAADLALGDLDAARQHADEAVAQTTGTRAHRDHGSALLASAFVAAGDKADARAEDLAHQSLAVVSDAGDKVAVVDALELLAALATRRDSPAEAVRLYGAADALHRMIGYRRYAIQQNHYESSIATLRGAIATDTFEQTWAEGATLTIDEAAAYANRRRGRRKRPSSGWASLTPSERDVAQHVADGLANKEIAQRLFVSRRTVQTHLTNIYRKLDITSRTQLVAEVARHR